MIDSLGTDNVIKLWDLGSGNLIKAMTGHEAYISTLEFSKNGELLVSGGDDDSVRVWSVKDAETKAVQSIGGQVTGSVNTTTSGLGFKRDESCVKTFHTKRTPIYSLSFTNRNILVALGVFEK